MSTPAHNYISDITHLKQWFMAQGCPQWNLYRDFHTRMPERLILHKQRDSQMEMEESFELLQTMIEINGTGGGRFTLFVPAYGASKGPSVLFGLNLSPQLSPQAANVAGIGGYGYAQMGMIPAGDVERRINDALERERLARKIEDLEAAADAKSDWTEVLMEKILQLDPDKALEKVGGLLAGFMLPAAGTPVQLRGVQNPSAPPATAPAPEEEAPGYEYNEDELMPLLDMVRQHFETEEAFMAAFAAFAHKFNSSPAMFIQMLS